MIKRHVSWWIHFLFYFGELSYNLRREGLFYNRKRPTILVVPILKILKSFRWCAAGTLLSSFRQVTCPWLAGRSALWCEIWFWIITIVRGPHAVILLVLSGVLKHDLFMSDNFAIVSLVHFLHPWHVWIREIWAVFSSSSMLLSHMPKVLTDALNSLKQKPATAGFRISRLKKSLVAVGRDIRVKSLLGSKFEVCGICIGRLVCNCVESWLVSQF